MEIISFYKFLTLSHLEDVKAELLEICQRNQISGSILIAPEGINGTISGRGEDISRVTDYFQNSAIFSPMEFKKSLHETKPFRRMLVRIKKEIITMKMNGIDPTHLTGKYLAPLQLKEWLDRREDIVLLDTRNDYEVKVGTFKGAIDPGIKSFSAFPDFIDKRLDELKGKKIVTFCTGGIRCEKATAYMVSQGLTETYQIEGGVLKYFEDTQNLETDNHWDGECVVFDSRLAVNKSLQPTEVKLCYSCFDPLMGSFPEGLCPQCQEVQILASKSRAKSGQEKYLKNFEERRKFLEKSRKEKHWLPSESVN
ncbi:MAG: rhodanese-like domain-containing protein [Pseudomonadota bacterium]